MYFFRRWCNTKEKQAIHFVLAIGLFFMLALYFGSRTPDSKPSLLSTDTEWQRSPQKQKKAAVRGWVDDDFQQQTIPSFRYAANGRRDPFMPPPALKNTPIFEPPIAAAAEFLADYSLEELQVVGEAMVFGRKQYLVRTPLGTLKRIQLGSVIGEAIVSAIKDGKLELVPITSENVKKVRKAWVGDCIGENNNIFCKPWPLGDYPMFR